MKSKEKNKKPFLYLCTGMSLDGKISTAKRAVDTKITVDDDRNFLYDHRVTCDAIMIGGKTIILDGPSLTVKSQERQKRRLALGKTKEPIKVGIISDISKLETKGDFFEKGNAKKIIFTTRRSPKSKIKKLENVCSVYVLGKQRVDLKRTLTKLYELGIKSVIAEGGGELIFSLLKDDLVDEINLKIGDLILGGRNAPTLVDGDGFSKKTMKQVKLINIERKKSYLMLKYKIIRKSEG
jgi:2,5-diamino-6-(ribosylamino)-4(3H)-pyrimidinone 5'-phosphate reductase